jgi:hypothetical protein
MRIVRILEKGTRKIKEQLSEHDQRYVEILGRILEIGFWNRFWKQDSGVAQTHGAGLSR